MDAIQSACDALSTTLNLWPAPLACFVCAGAVGILVAIVEILSRYGTGNNPTWVLCGKAQYLYYTINGLAAAGTLFASEALDKTKILDLYSTRPSLAILQAGGVGLAAMFALRSSLFSVEGKEDQAKVDVGPAQILNVLNKYLHRQIDKKRGSSALVEITKLMSEIDPDLIYPDILLCLTVSEAIPEADGTRMKDNIALIMANKQKFKLAESKAIAIGLEIQKELGLDTLKTVVECLQNIHRKKVSAQPAPSEPETVDPSLAPSNAPANEVDSLDAELSAAYVKLSKDDQGPSQ